MNLPDSIVDNGIVLKDQFFDLRGLSAYSSLAVPTLRDYVRSRDLPCFKLKGKILIRKSEFDTWVESFRMNKKKDLKRIVDGVLESIRAKKSEC